MMDNMTLFDALRATPMGSLLAISHLRVVDIACALGTLYAMLKVVQCARSRLKTTALRGPPNSSYLWGINEMLLTSFDSGAEFEKWAEEYGGVYVVSSGLAGRQIHLCDPRAIAHMFGGDLWTYKLTSFGKTVFESVVGKSILTAMSEDHKRQRKILTPAFSNAAIRNLTTVFYDSAYKVKGAWDSLIDASGGSAVIEVQSWMNRLSLDTIGIACFSHDFGTLDGEKTTVTEIFEAISNHGDSSVTRFTFLLAQVFPWLMRLPTPQFERRKRLNDTMGDISNALLTKSRKEKEAGTLGESEEKSILGLLIKAENRDNQLSLTPDEVVAMAKVLLVAGYETTSISLTWALIELSKNPNVQTKLRTELLEFSADPTYDQLFTSLPYLDAVVHETLRMHAPAPDFTRIAGVDDVIPLSKPVRTLSGKMVDHIYVARGTYLSVSVPALNRSVALWGPDAKEFKPERWITEDGIPSGAKEVQGHRHLLTFIDGPRTCLGKGFAIAEFKMVLSILVKNYVFEFEGGPGIEIELARGILPRPKVAGKEGTTTPLRVRRFE